MSLTVNSNISSLTAQRHLGNSTNSLTTAMERLASGSRINSAKDDAAGLQISNRLTSQINGLNVAVRNANDGISVAQVAEGALQESTNILQRMRELTLQAGNGANSAEDRDAIQAEIAQSIEELDRIATTTSFGTQTLLSGDEGGDLTLSFLVGAKGNEAITVNLGAGFDATTLGVKAVAVNPDTFVADNEDGDGTIQTALAAIDGALQNIDTQRAELGAVQNRFSSTIGNLQNIAENVSASRSRITDTDYAAETANLTKYQIMQQAGTAMLSQANQLPQAVLSLLG